MCQMYSEAKQTETSGFRAEKGLSQGHARRQVARVPQTPKLPEGFQQSVFKGQVREGGRRVRDQLLYGSLVG